MPGNESKAVLKNIKSKDVYFSLLSNLAKCHAYFCKNLMNLMVITLEYVSL